MAAAGGVANLASLTIIVIIFIAFTIIMSPSDAYDGTVLEYRCSTAPVYDTDAMSEEITLITNSLITGTNPGPPSAYLCAISDQNDGKLPDVWAWASCAERIAKDDCSRCLRDARDSLLGNQCPGKAGAHMYRTYCSIEYENYAICHPY